MAVLLGKGAGAADVLWLAHHLIVLAWENVESGLEPVLHEGDGKVGDVYAEPLPLQLLGGGHGGAAAAEGVKDNVPLVG